MNKRVLAAALSLTLLAGASRAAKVEAPKEAHMSSKLNVAFNGYTYTATLSENSSVDALVAYLCERGGAITVAASDYGSFEKVGVLETTLPSNNEPMDTVPGDLILYQGNHLVLYYANNSWPLTPIGKLDGDVSNLRAELGDGDVEITYSLPEDEAAPATQEESL